MNEQHPLVRIPTEPTRLNFFVVLNIGGAVLGIMLGFAAGHAFGTMGAIVGGMVGGFSGLIVGYLPGYLSQEWLFKSMQKKSNAELKAVVDEKEWTFIQTLALLNLHLRGEDVQSCLPRIIVLLESDDPRTRLFGLDALRWVCTELAIRIEDYDPRASTEECRRQVALLRTNETVAGDTTL
jgi:hypothetical protein